MIELVEAQDAHFAWLMTTTASFGGLVQPPGGLENGEVLTLLRGIAAGHRARGACGMWLIVLGQLVVGSCGYMREVADGVAEIGYGIAATCRAAGYATRAVAALVEGARSAGLRQLVAGTAVNNRASQIVLERNGFTRTGMRIDPEDGEVIEWGRSV